MQRLARLPTITSPTETHVKMHPCKNGCRWACSMPESEADRRGEVGDVPQAAIQLSRTVHIPGQCAGHDVMVTQIF
jgi:hypothetical protein